MQRIAFLDEDSIDGQNIEAWLNGNADTVGELRAAVRANDALRRASPAKKIPLNNIVTTTLALNGNLAVYLR